MNIILIGPPGAGKGTQAAFLENNFSLKQLSTGDMCRATMKENTDLGNKVRVIVEAGDLVPDDIMVQMISERIVAPDCANGFILDGFPRTIEQAKGLDLILKKIDHKIECVISLSADEDELVSRLLKRGLTSGRSDESIEIIRHRQQIYWNQTSPLLNYYEDIDLLMNVNGVGEINDINNEIIKIVNQYA